MSEFWITLVVIFTGAIGFLLATFWFRPILRYSNLKAQILSDFIFYANAINTDGLNEEMKKRGLARAEANRRHSADLEACFQHLPRLYLWLLSRRQEKPDMASKEMMGLSNTSDWEAAAKRIDKIRAFLRFPPER